MRWLPKNAKRKDRETQRTEETDQQGGCHDAFDKKPNLRERLADFAAFVLGTSPPVKCVQCCLDCASDDASEMTMPRALVDMADEHDTQMRDDEKQNFSIVCGDKFDVILCCR